MKYVLSFVAAFAITAGVTAWARVAASDRPQAPTESSKPDALDGVAADEHAGHVMGDEPKTDKKEEKKEEPKKDETPKWGGDVKEDLRNDKDPVDKSDIKEQGKFTKVYYGFKVHFSSEANGQTFEKRPYRYLHYLSLEPIDADARVKKVDAANYIDAAPATCPVMGNEIDTEDEVYILHRGFRVYFCCWMGCWKKFLTEPTKYYDAYGLEEKDGKLVKKSS
jgi:YHS domain-containing protein